MIPELQAIEEKYRKILSSLSDPAVIANSQKLREAAREKAELDPLIKKYGEYKRAVKDRGEALAMAEAPDTEAELRTMARAEAADLDKRIEVLSDEMRSLLVPKDPNDERNVILELRAGAGGDEASLFAQDLLRMYSRFAEKKGWKFEIMDTSISPIGGIKEAVSNIRGRGAFSLLKFESGVHRVQRVPKTESSGRIHTSTATVVVLPEAEDVEVNIDPKDIKIEAFGSSGPGGQNVNRNYTAIRITHKPSGLVVSCQDEKSQHRNKEKALKVLRSRLLNAAQQERQSELSQNRKSQVGTGERSEKIRTYNFPQSRITDHRLNESFHNMDGILDGELDEIIEKLVRRSETQALAEYEKSAADGAGTD